MSVSQKFQYPGPELNKRARNLLACSRLRDGGGKSFSSEKCEKRAGAGERQCASYFRLARINTFPLYYLRAWHRLEIYELSFFATVLHDNDSQENFVAHSLSNIKSRENDLAHSLLIKCDSRSRI